MLTAFLIVAGFTLLILGADLLVRGASSLAKRLSISDLAIGLTVVAFGTSCPELFVNLTATASGNTDIAIGNVLGSNICNTFLILGLSSLICPLTVSRGTVWHQIPFGLLAAVVLGLMTSDLWFGEAAISSLGRIDGLVLLCFFAVFASYVFSIRNEAENLVEQIEQPILGLTRSMAWIVLGLLGLTLGGHWTIRGAIRISQSLGISQTLVGLTIVAVGTSLPELATSTIAAWRGKIDIAVGNVVGSNIFNVFFILALSATIRPLPVPLGISLDLAVLILGSLMLFLAMFTGGRRVLDRWEGAVLLVGYVAYLVLIVRRG